MLENLLNEYKDYEPVLNYFHKNCYECQVHDYPEGWHCSIAIKSFENIIDNIGWENKAPDRVHTNGQETALKALEFAIKLISK
jgi:hypothetical protein